MLAHSVGWPVVEGGSQVLADAMARVLRRPRRRDRDRARGATRWPSCRRRGRPCSTSRRPSWCAWPATALPASYRRSLQRVPLRARGVQGRLRPVRSGSVDQRGLPPSRHRAPRRQLRRGRGERGRRLRRPDQRQARTSWPCRRRSPTRPGRPPDSTRCGPTATCPTVRRSTVTAAIEAQVERFAPGFRDLVLGRATRNSVEYEAYDANFVGGDINGGTQTHLADRVSADAALEPVHHSTSRRLPVLGVDPARRRRARHVRLQRSPGGAAPGVRPEQVSPDAVTALPECWRRSARFSSPQRQHSAASPGAAILSFFHAAKYPAGAGSAKRALQRPRGSTSGERCLEWRGPGPPTSETCARTTDPAHWSRCT